MRITAIIGSVALTLGLALPAAATASVQPVGSHGNWGHLTFDDEFSGSSLNQVNWPALYTPTTVTVSGGVAHLRPALHPALTSNPAIMKWGTSTGFALPVRGWAEARIYLDGSGHTIYNWPTWWLNGPNWPAGGEQDIAEVLGGTLQIYYHTSHGTYGFGTVPGTWVNGWHTFSLYRGTGYCKVFYDGKLVKQYTAKDNASPEALVLTNGPPWARPASAMVATAQMRVDYVRAWSPN